MSQNTIRASLDFSFKGKTYELAVSVDLDQSIVDSREEPNFHHHLARAGGIDTYSYLYEVLESHEIEFTEPTGLAAHSCRDGAFDWPEFARHWRDERDLQVVRAIAERTLGVGDLNERPDLLAALLAAYRAGKAEAAG